MTIFLVLILAAAALAIAVFPLVKPSLEVGPASYSGEDEVQALRRKKEIVYGNIKDLDFEYKMGKLGELDYQRLRNELKLDAALLMEQMDRAKKGRSTEEALEAEILARRAKSTARTAAPGEAAAFGDQGTAESLELRCPQCHSPYNQKAKFCAECGFNLQV